MVLFGKVTRLIRERNAGIITDQHGRDFYFLMECCVGFKLPPLFSTVTFIQDMDARTMRVADLIQIDQYPRGYVDNIMSQVDEE